MKQFLGNPYDLDGQGYVDSDEEFVEEGGITLFTLPAELQGNNLLFDNESENDDDDLGEEELDETWESAVFRSPVFRDDSDFSLVSDTIDESDADEDAYETNDVMSDSTDSMPVDSDDGASELDYVTHPLPSESQQTNSAEDSNPTRFVPRMIAIGHHRDDTDNEDID